MILRPGVRRADAYDLFLAGRDGDRRGRAVHDVDQGSHLAVTVDDDPGADLKDAHGRYLYFAPDEVEPLRSPEGTGHEPRGPGRLRRQHLQVRRRVRGRGRRRGWPAPTCRTGVRVVDFGIRSVHLVYELLDGYDVLVLVDTVAQQDGPPGSLYVIEPDLPPRDRRRGCPRSLLDAHDLSPGRGAGAGADARRARSTGSWWWAASPSTWRTASGSPEAVAAAVEPAADLVMRRRAAASWPAAAAGRLSAREEVDEMRKLCMLGVLAARRGRGRGDRCPTSSATSRCAACRRRRSVSVRAHVPSIAPARRRSGPHRDPASRSAQRSDSPARGSAACR